MDQLQERINRYAQALVDDTLIQNSPHRKMTLAEAEANSISAEESKQRVTELIHHFYHSKK